MKMKSNVKTLQGSTKWKPNLSLFSSPLASLNLSPLQFTIEPKMDTPESKKDVTQIYNKKTNQNSLF